MTSIFLKQHGISLPEMLVTLSIISILLGLLVPGFNTFIQEIHVSMLAHDIHRSLMQTRSEAIKRNDQVHMEAIAGNWNNGWHIVAGDEIIRVHTVSNNKSLIITSKSTDGGRYFAYAGTGRTRTKASPFTPQSGSINVTMGEAHRRIIVNFFGRSRICRNTNLTTDTCLNTPN